MGLSTTLNRELAKYNADKGYEQYMKNLVFSMELIYLIIAVLAAVGLTIASWFFAKHWVKAEKLETHTIVSAFILMAINFGLQFPASLYQGGLMGLQRQVTLNIILSSIATLKAVGAIFILWFISPTITAFLTWQVILSLLQLILFRRYLWKYLPGSDLPPHFNKSAIRNSGKYAAGIMGISILSVILTQSDKIILSNLVKLTEFGYYTLAATIAGSLLIVLFPVSSAVFPRFTELTAKNDKTKLLELFHASSQLVSVIIIPLGLSLFIFAGDIIIAWTRNATIASGTEPILRFLIFGATVNSLMLLPYQYTLSIGWLRFGININLIANIVFFPFIFLAVLRFGAIGAAFMWMILNICYLFFAMSYLFSKHLQTEKKKWYLYDVARPLFICAFFAFPFFLLRQYISFTNLEAMLALAFCLIVCYSATFWFGTPDLRPEMLRVIRKIRRTKLVLL